MSSKRKRKYRGIGTENERSLHSNIKKWYSVDGDSFELKINGYIIDIVRNNLLIEIQTGNFSKIRKKFLSLLKEFRIRLVYPISVTKWILKKHPRKNKILYRRRSPKKGKLTDLFEELVYIPDIVAMENFSMEVLMIEEEQIRCDDGEGSWWRRGVSIVDRRLLKVLNTIRFNTMSDFRMFLPPELPSPFANKDLALMGNYSVDLAGKITYCLKKIGTIKEVGKRRNALLFEINKFN